MLAAARVALEAALKVYNGEGKAGGQSVEAALKGSEVPQVSVAEVQTAATETSANFE